MNEHYIISTLIIMGLILGAWLMLDAEWLGDKIVYFIIEIVLAYFAYIWFFT